MIREDRSLSAAALAYSNHSCSAESVISPGSAGVRLRIDCFSAALGLPVGIGGVDGSAADPADQCRPSFQSPFAQTRRTSEMPHESWCSPESVMTSGAQT